MADDSFSFPSPFCLTDADTADFLVEDFNGEEMMAGAGNQQQQFPSVLDIPDPLDPYVAKYEIRWEISMNKQRTDPVAYGGISRSISPPLIAGNLEEISMHKQIEPPPSAATCLVLLGNYWNGLNRQMHEKLSKKKIEEAASVDWQRLSTVEIIKLAGERFIQLQEQRDDYFSVVTHPCEHSFSGLSEADTKDGELTLMLLAAAEKVGEHQFDCASRFLSHCTMLSLKRGNPTQRIVLCFSSVLSEQIDKATGKYEPKVLQELSGDLCLATNLNWLPCYGRLPLNQITQFASVQAMVDNTATASRIHAIDLALRSGIHMIVLMQALSERKTKAVELLKITAVATAEREKVEESGRRLVSVAKTMGLNFSFEVIFIDNIEEIDEDMFDVEDGEAVAIYASMVLKTMISHQNSLEKLTGVLRNLNPSVMVVTEIEANHNSPSFVSRFIETLFFYGASFDCIETCMADDDENRTVTELYLRDQVKNILSMDDNERTTRNVKIDVWRAFFKRYRMVEIGFSECSLYQARLVAQKFPCASFCTIEHDRKCLIVGWRGTPLLSLSAWKFR